MTMVEGSEMNALKYSCYRDGCQKNYKNKFHLLEHIRIDHDNIRFTCEFCAHGSSPFEAKRKTNLIAHLEKAHGFVKCKGCKELVILSTNVFSNELICFEDLSKWSTSAL